MYDPFNPLEWYEAHEDDVDAPRSEDSPASLLFAVIGSAGLIVCLIAAGFAAYYLG